MIWPPSLASPARLVRWFQAPPIDPRLESIGLQLDDVAGLVAVELNGRELARPTADTESIWLPLPTDPPLPRRNELVLEVVPGGARGERPSGGRPWGEVALVISPRTCPDPPPAF